MRDELSDAVHNIRLWFAKWFQRRRCLNIMEIYMYSGVIAKKVQIGKDQEKAQSEKDSHPENRCWKKTN